jgi:N6-adenosine-specific RNA methylase IME4
LVVGHHRYAAAQKLGWEKIDCIVRKDLDAVDAELVEIDENLVRADLTPAEQAAHHARRKELHERKHPETKSGQTGRGRGKVRQNGEANERYTKDTAEKTGASERTVQRHVERGTSIPNVSELAGTCLDQGAELDALARLKDVAPDRQANLIERAKSGEKVSAKTEIKKVKRAKREAELGHAQASGNLKLPTRQYNVILEDFEWDDEVRSRETGMDRHASNHFPTSKTAHTPEEIVAATRDRFVACAAPDCVVFFWTTIQHAAIAFEILKLRGLTYKSQYVWVKPHISTGFWTRSRHEVLLIATRGHVPCPAQGTQWASIVEAPRPGGHSEKPDAFYEMIEAYYPTLPKIELNARKARDGWDRWGLDAPDLASNRAAPPIGEGLPLSPEAGDQLAQEATA